MLWTQREKNAINEKYMKCMQEDFGLLGGIEGFVEEDFNRSTHVLSKQKDEKIGSMYQTMYREVLRKIQKTSIEEACIEMYRDLQIQLFLSNS